MFFKKSLWLVLMIVNHLGAGFTVEKLDLQVDVTKEVNCPADEKATKGDKVKFVHL